MPQPPHPQKPIEITIDGEPYEAPQRKVTPRELMVLAGVDPQTHYLTEAHGRKDESYKDRPDAEITLHPGSEFHTVPLGDTTVS